MLDGAMPACPPLYFGVVDVRDVAELHLRAMTDPAARGERFLAVGDECLSLAGIARVLKERLGPDAQRVSTRELPAWLVRLAALRNRAAREILPELGRVKNASNAKARRLLGWVPRSSEEAIVAAGHSLVRLKLLKEHTAARAAVSAAAPAPARR
jgi:nucleoside-diphosphate-sugar epimerase